MDNENVEAVVEDILNRIAQSVIPDAAFVKFSKEDIKVFFDFAEQLTVYDKTAKLPDAGSQNVKYFLQIQKQRLKNRGLQVRYNFQPVITQSAYIQSQQERELFANKGLGIIGKKYSCLSFEMPFEKQLCIYRDGNCVFKEEGKEVILHQTAVRLNDVKTGDQISYICPNCGAISKVSELLNGCAYCGSYFVMTDLFPKITDFYFTQQVNAFADSREDAEKKKGFLESLDSFMKKRARPLGILIFGTGALGGILLQAVKGEIDGGIAVFSSAIMGVCGAFWVCAFLLLIILVVIMAYLPFGICKMISDRHRKKKKDNPHGSISMELISNRDYKKIDQFVKQYDPKFSMEYFKNKMVSYLKMILLTDKIDHLTFYRGSENKKSFDRIVDVNFSGMIQLVHSAVRQNRCYLTINFYMADLWDNGEKLERRADVFQLSVCKDLAAEEDPGISPRVVACPNCGGSFNASKEKYCPYCGTEYPLPVTDWLVMDVQQIK